MGRGVEFTYASCAGEHANGCTDLGGHLAAALQQYIVDIRLLKCHTVPVVSNGVQEMKKEVGHTSSALANDSPATPPPTMTTRKRSVLDMMQSCLLFGPVLKVS